MWIISEEDVFPTIVEGVFVGSTGVSVFTNDDDGTITTSNVSLIVGFVGGTLFVESEGQIIDGTGEFKDVEGGFVSSSTITLAPVFELDVEVTFTLTESD